VLGLVHLFPHQNFGLEIASVLMIFTGQVWNMTFSFYSSLKSVPPDLVAVCPSGADVVVGTILPARPFLRRDRIAVEQHDVNGRRLVFLMVSEAFVLGEHDFRLPGLGSYMSLAIERGNGRRNCSRAGDAWHDRVRRSDGLAAAGGVVAQVHG